MVSFIHSQIIENPKVRWTRAKGMFTLGCFLLAAYMTLTQIIRFLGNGDTSIITHKKFNQSPQDKYPTFSICIQGQDIYWNHVDNLFWVFGMTSEEYVEMLKGNGWRYTYDISQPLYKKEAIKLNDFVKYAKDGHFLTFEDENFIPLYPLDIFTGAHFLAQDINDTTYYGGDNKGTRLQHIPFYIGYRTSDTICFTRNSSNDRLGLIRLYDLLSLNSLLLKPGNHLFVEFRIIFHYPGQLVRNFHKPIYRSTLASYDKDKVLQLTVSHVTKLINRPDSNIGCYAGKKRDDNIFEEELIKHINCTPIYWKNLLNETQNKRLCKSPKQLRDADFHLSFGREYLSSYDPPCVDMKTSVTYSRELTQRKNEFLLKIVYKDNVFQEITNEKAFTFETFFSSMGGFVGIFLGYSVLQIPDLINNMCAFLKRSRYQAKISKYVWFNFRVVYQRDIYYSTDTTDNNFLYFSQHFYALLDILYQGYEWQIQIILVN